MRECNALAGIAFGQAAGRRVDIMPALQIITRGLFISVPGQSLEFAVECVPRPLGAQEQSYANRNAKRN